MVNRVANALLRCVYYPVTAVVCTGRRRRLISVKLFDSGFVEKERIIPPGTRRIDVICSHPEGCMMLTKKEISNIRWIASQAHEARIFLYVYGEDIGLNRVDSGVLSSYNGENAC